VGDLVFASVPRVCDAKWFCGAAATADARPDLVIEVPHGATRAADFSSLRAELRGPFPEGLEDFFFVNTDVGAPEVAERVAALVVAAAPRRTALVLRCRIPRTFIDCNRVIDEATRPAASAAGAVTPGVAEYVRDERDFRLLLSRYSAYRDLTTRAIDEVCARGGLALHLHSYAPRSIDVPVDERIVERLRTEYREENLSKWPLRAEVDLITRDPSGTRLAGDALVAAVQAALDRTGLRHAESAAYGLHPATLAGLHAAHHPGRTLCVEMRRDLLATEFTPFAEMEIDPAKADRFARAFADGIAATSS